MIGITDGGALAAEFALLLIVFGVGLVGSLAGLIGQFRLDRAWDSIDAACDRKDALQYRLNRATRMEEERYNKRLAEVARLELERNVKRLAEKQARDRQILALEMDVMAINAYLAFVMPDYSRGLDPILLLDDDSNTLYDFLNLGDVPPMMEVIR